MLLTPGLFVVGSLALANAVDLVVGAILLPFLIHDEDPLLPLVVCLGKSYPDVGDDQCVRPWYSLSHSSDHHSAAFGIVAPSCQLGFLFQLLEEDGGGIAAHLHVLHPLLVLFFDGGIPECSLEFADKVVPVWVLESGSCRILIVVDPEVLASVGPPALGAFYKERGGANHHEQ